MVRIELPKPNGEGRVIGAHGTKVFVDRDGQSLEVSNIMRITINPLEPGNIITAEIDVAVNIDTIHAHAFLSLDSLRAAAEFHGLTLVSKAESSDHG